MEKEIEKKLSFRILRKYHHLIDKRILRQNAQYKDLHKGKRCFIVGSGPSIKNQDLTKLSQEPTFVMNTFCLHEKYKEIHPKFYVIFHSEYLRGDETSMKFLRELEAKIHDNTIMILPLKVKRFFEEKNILPKNKKIYIYVRGFLSKPQKKHVDITKTVPTPMSVSVMCLMVALYMGFDPIYIMGAEHSWLAMLPEAEFEHFSDGKREQYLHRNNKETYEENMTSTLQLFKNYRFINTGTKAKIYNLTPNSYLDVFPKKKYEEVVS